MVKISKILLCLLILTVISLSISNTIFIYQNIERNRVIKVIDGDSFETRDGRRIRLLGIDAPEKERCLYSEAREELHRLTLGKRVKLVDLVVDDYGRILANVFVSNWLCQILHLACLPARQGGVMVSPIRQAQDQPATPEVSSSPTQIPNCNHLFINQIMLEKGLARFSYVTSSHYDELLQVAKLAKIQKIGIYSTVCRNQNPPNECEIKGNIREGEKIYHLPSCPNYKQVIIDEAFGDKWFCSEEEAVSAGFRKVSGC